MKSVDYTKDYQPETKVCIDIPTALVVFDPTRANFVSATLRKTAVEACEAWNQTFSRAENSDDRSPISRYIVVASHTFGAKPVEHESKLVLSVSNYFWIRDQCPKLKTEAATCKPEDFHVGFKLSSTVFRPQSGQAPPDEATAQVSSTNSAGEFFFDFHGLNLTLREFETLLEHPGLAELLQKVNAKYNADVFDSSSRNLVAGGEEPSQQFQEDDQPACKTKPKKQRSSRSD